MSSNSFVISFNHSIYRLKMHKSKNRIRNNAINYKLKSKSSCIES